MIIRTSYRQRRINARTKVVRHLCRVDSAWRGCLRIAVVDDNFAASEDRKHDRRIENSYVFGTMVGGHHIWVWFDSRRCADRQTARARKYSKKGITLT